MTTSPEDAAAMFDLPPLPASPPAARPSMEDEEAALAAALAAELESTIESGGVAADAPDSRTDLRVRVSWTARMQLPDGRLIGLRVRDISQGGVGLASDEHMPACTVVNVELAVPPLDEGGRMALVQGTIKTTYTADHGAEFRGGATWVQLSPAGRELVNLWIERLRR
jgi:hypothetical protein